MSKINATWHLAHKMPKNPTEEARLKWHAEHMKFCSCRVPSPKLMQQMKSKGLIE